MGPQAKKVMNGSQWSNKSYLSCVLNHTNVVPQFK